MRKRILALITAAVMVLAMMPAMAFAESTEPVSGIEINEENFPDENFRERLLQRYDEDSDGMFSDYEIKYIEELQLGSENIKDLTGIEYFTEVCVLYCNDNQLTNLDLNKLKKLNYVNCKNNQLTSLNISECCNIEYLYCSNNKLTALEINPDAEYRELIVNYNDLPDESAVTINGKASGYDFEYGFHPQSWVQPVDINEANFPDSALREKLKYETNGDDVLTPAEIANMESLDLNNSGLENLTGIHHLINLRDLDVTANYLTELPELPDSIEDLRASYNYLTKITNIPENLEDLFIYGNDLKSLPELPDGLEYLCCDDNSLASLPELPDTLTYLTCERNQLTSLPALSAELEELYCSGNKLKQMPVLPNELEYMRCADNELTALPELPYTLVYLDCENNKITELPELPKKIQHICVGKNEIGGVLDLSQLRYLSIVDAYHNRITGVKLNDAVKYERLNVSHNAMKSEADVTGRDDISWGDGQFYFGTQKSACDLNGHKYVKKVHKANFNMSGCEEYICSVCEAWDDERYVYWPILDFPKDITKAYTGSVLSAPKFVVKEYKGKTLKQGTDYTVKKVTSAKLKNVGKYKYKITLKGSKYSGYTYAYVTVNPKATSITKVTKPAKKQIKVTWQKRTAQVTGYEVRYSTTKNFTKKTTKTVKVKSYKTTSKTIKKLKAKKKYWVQVRTYKTVKGTKYYSKWSAKKTVTTK